MTFPRVTYEILPELMDPGRIYAIGAVARKIVIRSIAAGYYKGMLIIFYGGYASGMRGSDAGALRYICGIPEFITTNIKRKRFVVWMDYRLYTFIPNDDLTQGVIGRPCDFSSGKLLSMATFVSKQRKLALLKKRRIWLEKNGENPEVVKARKKFKNKIDSAVHEMLRVFNKTG